MSRRPGIGSTWFDRYKTDAFPSDFLIVDGKKHAVPKFYTQKLEQEEIEHYKKKRKWSALGRKHDNTPDRRAIKAEVRDSRIKMLKRKLD